MSFRDHDEDVHVGFPNTSAFSSRRSSPVNMSPRHDLHPLQDLPIHVPPYSSDALDGQTYEEQSEYELN